MKMMKMTKMTKMMKKDEKKDEKDKARIKNKFLALLLNIDQLSHHIDHLE
jgi:hypothetical protein